MTCNELHDHLESGRSLFRTDEGLSSDITAHIEHCSSCHRWVQMEEQLSGQLRLLRNSAPLVPTTLDESILSAYRRQMQQPVNAPTPVQKVSWSEGIFWRAAIAALVLLGAIVLFGHRKTVNPPSMATVQPPPVAEQTQGRTQSSTEPAKTIATQKSAKRHVQRETVVRKTQTVSEAGASTEAAVNTLPSDFRSLMYCDQLSCSGAMELIRMNLPASALGMASPLRSSNVVAADVVIGADGVARAIRIVN
jgi:hypothetical protein